MKCSDGSYSGFFLFSIIKNLLLLAFFQFSYTIFFFAVLFLPFLYRMLELKSIIFTIVYSYTLFSRFLLKIQLFFTTFSRHYTLQFFVVHYLNEISSLLCIEWERVKWLQFVFEVLLGIYSLNLCKQPTRILTTHYSLKYIHKKWCC